MNLCNQEGSGPANKDLELLVPIFEELSHDERKIKSQGRKKETGHDHERKKSGKEGEKGKERSCRF